MSRFHAQSSVAKQPPQRHLEMEQLLLGELGASAATATQVAPGVFSFKPSAPTEEEKAA